MKTQRKYKKTQRKYKKTQRKYKKTHKKRRALRNKSRKSMKGGNASMKDIIDMAKKVDKNNMNKLRIVLKQKFETHVNEAHICENLNKIDAEILSESEKNDSDNKIIDKLKIVRNYIKERYPMKYCKLPPPLPPSEVEDEDPQVFEDSFSSNVVVEDQDNTQYLVPLEMEDGKSCQSDGLEGITRNGYCIPVEAGDGESCQSDGLEGITRNGHCIPFEKNERPLTRQNAMRNPNQPQLYKKIVRNIHGKMRTVNVDPRQAEALYEVPITAIGGTRKRAKRRT